jgi:hypothetical protein
MVRGSDRMYEVLSSIIFGFIAKKNKKYNVSVGRMYEEKSHITYENCLKNYRNK